MILKNIYRKLRLFCFILLIVTVSSNSTLFAQPFTKQQLIDEFDKLLSGKFKSGPGCAVLVAQKGEIIYKKAIGMANMELKVPLQPDMVFRLASLTKEFTAVAILQLVEQGKISLTDNITKYIPEYPTQNYTITIENLLTHTSGIKDLNAIIEFNLNRRKDYQLIELIDLIKKQPLIFAPGTKCKYSNSGFIILGYIIELVSGKPYADYLEENIFRPAGMKNTCYDNTEKIIVNRVSGYSPVKNVIQNAPYESMISAFSAGGLMSTVDDLYKWTQALYQYKIIKKETLENATKPYTLSDGSVTDYGYGFFLGNIQGSREVYHPGGVSGFQSFTTYLPDEDVLVAMLTNCNGSFDYVAERLAALTIGKPYPKEIQIDKNILYLYTGVYENTKDDQLIFVIENDKLIMMRAEGGKSNIINSGGTRNTLFAHQNNKFFNSSSLANIEFITGDSGKVVKMNFSNRQTINEIYFKTNKPIPVKKEKIEIKVDEKILGTYVGEYELVKDLTLNILLENGKLFILTKGQPKNEIFAESENKFFFKNFESQIEFIKDETGKISKLILYNPDGQTTHNRIK